MKIKQCRLKEFKDPEYLNLKFGICDFCNANLILSGKEIKELYAYSLKHDQNLSINGLLKLKVLMKRL